MEATWLTFAVTVVAVQRRRRSCWPTRSRGEQLRVNQVDVVDFDAEVEPDARHDLGRTSSARESTPTICRSRHDPTADDGGTDRGRLFSWMGLPGNGFGGMNSTTGSTVAVHRTRTIFRTHLDRMERVPIAIWSSKAFVGRWWQRAASRRRGPA